MSKLVVLTILLLSTYSVVNGFNDYEQRLAETPETDSAHGFHQLGYITDNDNNHILAVKIPRTATKEQVEQYARDQTNKAEKIAVLYFFEDGPEISTFGVNVAESLLSENNLLHSKVEPGEWRFSFLRKLNGATRMVDCDKYPESDLCGN